MRHRSRTSHQCRCHCLNLYLRLSLSLRCLLCRLSVVAGGCGWLPQPQPQSRNLSHLQFELLLFLLLLLFVDCLISAVVFLCLVRARQSQQQFETSTKPFKLLFAFVALFDFARNAQRKGAQGGEGGGGDLVGGTKLGAWPKGLQPFQRGKVYIRLEPWESNALKKRYKISANFCIDHRKIIIIIVLFLEDAILAHQNYLCCHRNLDQRRFLHIQMPKLTLIWIFASQRGRDKERGVNSFYIVDCIFNMRSILSFVLSAFPWERKSSSPCLEPFARLCSGLGKLNIMQNPFAHRCHPIRCQPGRRRSSLPSSLSST